MPYKHQAQSYRIRDGVRFACDGDICEGDVRQTAKLRVQELRLSGKRAFFESHPEGYCRVFVEE